MRLRQGESLERKLAEGRWEEIGRHFLGVRLPKYVYRANAGLGYGTTVLTYDGPVHAADQPIRPEGFLGYFGGR